jgi:hypothetical protein
LVLVAAEVAPVLLLRLALVALVEQPQAVAAVVVLQTALTLALVVLVVTASAA